MAITKLNGTLVYVQLDQAKPCFVADKGFEWKTSIVVDEDTADQWDEQFPKQTAKQVKTAEFEGIYKIAPPYPDQRKQYVITLRKNTKLGNGNDVPTQYQPKVFQQKGSTLVDITKSILVSNGSTGSVSVEVYEGKMGVFARLKNVKVDNLIEYVKQDSASYEPGSEFDADDGDGGTVKVPPKAVAKAKVKSAPMDPSTDDEPF